MYHEILSPEQAAEMASWWRQAFEALADAMSSTSERDLPI